MSDAALPASKGKAATINDIARLSGVSKKTVSRIINNSPLVRKDTRDKVEALMREVGYVPDPLARGLAFRRSFLIGLVYDDPGAQCIVDLQHGALEALRGTGYELVVHPCDSQDPECAQGVRRFVQQQKLHGVILGPRASESVALAQMLDDIDCRYVRINAHASEEDVQAVVTHDRDGAAAAAGYLLSLGHRDIAVIAGPGDRRAARERTHGFLDRLAQVGLTLPGERVLEAGDTFESGVHAAERLLLELKGKMGSDLGLSPSAQIHSAQNDILQALMTLGYSDKEASAAFKQLPADIGVSEGIKQALKALAT